MTEEQNEKTQAEQEDGCVNENPAAELANPGPQAGEEGDDPDLLVKVREAGYLLKVRLQEEQLECRADLDVIDEDEMLSPSELLGILHEVGVKETADQEAIVAFCQEAAAGTPQQSVLLARGREPVRGEDGWFELAVKIEGEADFVEDDFGNVDLRTLNTFTGLKVGDKIGTVHAAKAGIAGLTAHGLPIPAEPGTPYLLQVGDGVELKYDGRVAFATKAGRALLDKQVLSVVDEFLVSGDVDLHVGNIDFNGFVEIKGDVLDDFSIKATKGIRIEGIVGACTLETDGPVEIGSMAGKEVGSIRCHGDLIARFLNQVNVECHGNLIVANEIRNSNIKATRSITVESGVIAGGHCIALEGIQADTLGSTSGQKTYLKAGVYFPEVDQLDYLRNQLKSVKLQIKRIHAALGPLEKLQSQDHDEPTARASGLRLAILNKKWEKLEQEKELLVSEIDSFRCQEHGGTNPKINAVKTLMEGVVISLGNTTKEVKFEHTGPISVIENSRSGGLRYLDMTPLQTKANEVEKELLKLEAAAEREAGM